MNVGRTSIDVEARPYSNIHTEHQAHRVGLDAAFGGGGTVEEYYSYDAVGNRTAVLDGQGDTLNVMRHNRLNLPEEYTTASGDEVQYVYSADGEKLFVQLTTSANVTTGTEYAANYRLEDGTITMIHTDAGYYTPVPPPSGVGNPTYNHIWYLKDHLGNNRVLADASGTVYAVNDYDPFGNSMTSPITGTQPTFPAGTTASPYKYAGKEWNVTTSTYDFEARQMAPGFHRFTTMDPLCEKYYGISPYAYCADNPVNMVDPSGLSTYVYLNADGTYTVTGEGNAYDGDNGVYVGYWDKDGWHKSNNKIGETATPFSFYDTECSQWQVGSIIDMNDSSGKDFFKFMRNENIPLGEYMMKAKEHEIYDFKDTNGQEGVHGLNPYRGMPLLTRLDGTVVIVSARDVGNLVAGYYASANGFSWGLSRWAFDKYEGKQEALSTQAAQYYGWMMGRKLPLVNHVVYFVRSSPSLLSRLNSLLK